MKKTNNLIEFTSKFSLIYFAASGTAMMEATVEYSLLITDIYF